MKFIFLDDRGFNLENTFNYSWGLINFETCIKKIQNLKILQLYAQLQNHKFFLISF